MSQRINKKTFENLLSLSRIRLTDEEKKNKEEKLICDLQNILDYFKELEEVNTENISFTSGGRSGEDEYRADEEKSFFVKKDVLDALPDVKNGYLRVPAVLEHKKKRGKL